MSSVTENAALNLVLLATADVALFILTFVGKLERLVLAAFLAMGAIAEWLVLRLPASAIVVCFTFLQKHLHRLLLGDLSSLAMG